MWVTPEVSAELPQRYPSGDQLQNLIRRGLVRVEAPTAMPLRLFGPGERAAINLALEHPDWALLIDDLRPFRAAEGMGLRPISTPVYAASLFERDILDETAVLGVLARLAARSTVSPHLIDLALSQVANAEKKEKS